MLNITIGEKEYTLEFTFEAAENKDLMQKMFNIVSGAYLYKHVASIGDKSTDAEAAMAMADGSAEMISEIPHIVKTAFYAGLLANNPVSMEDSYKLLKQYMIENKFSYNKVFEQIKKCMEDDGFFDLSGLTEMLEQMNQAMELKTTKRSSKKK